MATAHVTRARGVRSARTRATRQSPPPVPGASPAPRRPVSPRSKPKPTPRRAPHPVEELRALGQMARRLEVLYSTCVTVELALKGQNGEQDEEIARCLMRNVTEPLSEHAEALQAIVRSLERRWAGQGVRP
jgi:hypothetical protein